MKLIRSFYYSFGTKILSLLILLISRLLTARILGPGDLGSVGSALNFITIISRWGSMGTGPATQFISSKYTLQRNTLLSYVIFTSLLLGLSNFLLLACFKAEILSWHFQADTNARLAYLKFIPYLPLIMVSMNLPILLLGTGQIRKYSFTQILPLLLQTMLISTAYFLPESLDFIILAQVIYWISTVIIAFILFDLTNFRFEFDRGLFLIFVRYSLKSWPQVILQFGITRFAVLIGSQYLDNKDLGYYILATNISEAFLVINTSVTPLIFNKIATQGSNLKLLGTSLRLSFISFLPVFLITILIGEPLFHYFFGPDFDKSWNLLLLLLISVLFQSIARICFNYLAAAGKNIIVSSIQLLQLALLALLSQFLCPIIGVSGLCYASICGSITGSFFSLFALKRYEGGRLGIFSLLKFNKEDINIIIRILRFRPSLKNEHTETKK